MFGHGQLYIALQRSVSHHGVKIQITVVKIEMKTAYLKYCLR